MTTTQHTLAATTEQTSSDWPTAEFIRPSHADSLRASLSDLLAASTVGESVTSGSGSDSKQARRKRRKKRKKKHTGSALGLRSTNIHDGHQSDHSVTSVTTASSGTEELRSRPGTPSSLSNTSGLLSPILSPTMEPIRVDELEGMEPISVGAGSTASATLGSTREPLKWRGESVEANRSRPCSPLRVAQLLDRKESSTDARSTGTGRESPVWHRLRRPISPAPGAISPIHRPSSPEQQMLTTSTAPESAAPASLYQLIFSASTAGVSDEHLQATVAVPADPRVAQNSVSYTRQPNILEEDGDGEDADQEQDSEHDTADEEEGEDGYSEDERGRDGSWYPTGEEEEEEVDEMVETELDDHVPELPSLLASPLPRRHRSWRRTRSDPLRVVLRATKSTLIHEWPVDTDGSTQDVEPCPNHVVLPDGEEELDAEECRLLPRPRAPSNIVYAYQKLAPDMPTLDDHTAADAEVLQIMQPAANCKEPGHSPPYTAVADTDGLLAGVEVIPDTAVLAATAPASSPLDTVQDFTTSSEHLPCSGSGSEAEEFEDRPEHDTSAEFTRVSERYLAQQNHMLERELEYARNTVHALREIIRLQDERLRETAYTNRELSDRIRTMEHSISRELADLQQRRHHQLPVNGSRRRALTAAGVNTGHYARRGNDSLLDTRRRRERTAPDAQRRDTSSSGQWQSVWQAVGTPEPATQLAVPADDGEEACPAATPETSQEADSAMCDVSSPPATPTAQTDSTAATAGTSPSAALRRDLSDIWRDLRVETGIVMPSEDEGYGSGQNKDAGAASQPSEAEETPDSSLDAGKGDLAASDQVRPVQP